MIGSSVEEIKKQFSQYTTEQLRDRLLKGQKTPDPFGYLAMSEYAERLKQSAPVPQLETKTVAQQLLEGQIPEEPQGMPLQAPQPQAPQLQPQAPQLQLQPQLQRQAPQPQPQAPQPQPQPQVTGMRGGGHVHDYGVATLPYTPNYEQGGIVSFNGEGESIVGYSDLIRKNTPTTPKFFNINNPSEAGFNYYSREELEKLYPGVELPPEVPENPPSKEPGFIRARFDTLPSKLKALFPSFYENNETPTSTPPPPSTPVDSGYKVTKVVDTPQKTEKNPQEAEPNFDDMFAKIIGGGGGGSGGAGSGRAGLESLYKNYEDGEINFDPRTARDESAILTDLNRSRTASGLDIKKYEQEQNDLLASKKTENKGKTKRDLWLAASEAFAGLAGGKNWNEGLSNFAKIFAVGAKDAAAASEERDNDLEALEQAHKDAAFARKTSDANLIYETRQKELEAERNVKDKIAELKEAKRAKVFEAKHAANLAAIQEAGANARNNQSDRIKLFLGLQDAQTELAKLQSTYGIEMAKLAATQLKAETPSAEDIAAVETKVAANFKEQIDAFVENNADADGFIYLVRDENSPTGYSLTKDKAKGQPVNAKEYYTKELVNDGLTALKTHYNTLRQYGNVLNSFRANSGIATLPQ